MKTYICDKRFEDGMESGPSTAARLPEPGLMPKDERPRPRERLMEFGPGALSDKELLMALLNSGVKGRNVAVVAEDLLERLDGGKAVPSAEDLRGIIGLGESKACAVAAMLEFGRRRWAGGVRIRRPSEAYALIRHYADRRQERFICVSLNGAHEVLAVRMVTQGLVNRTIIHPREVFADALQDRASAVIVAHNHPSGITSPSEEDHEITIRLSMAAEVLGITFMDHIIIAETGWFSFSKERLLRRGKTAALVSAMMSPNGIASVTPKRALYLSDAGKPAEKQRRPQVKG